MDPNVRLRSTRSSRLPDERPVPRPGRRRASAGRCASTGATGGPRWTAARPRRGRRLPAVASCSASTTPRWSARRGRCSSARSPTCEQPDAVIMDEAGYNYLWPGQPHRVGQVLEMNDRRAVIVGMCKVGQPFQTPPIFYTRYRQAMQFVAARAAADVVRCRRAGRGGVAASNWPAASRPGRGSGPRRKGEFDRMTIAIRPEATRASRSTSASPWCSASSSAAPSPGRRSTCSRSRT